MRAWPILLAATLAWGQDVPAVERVADVAMAFAQQESSRLGGEYRFKVGQPPRVPMIQAKDLTFQATHLSKRDPVGRFFVVVAMKVGGQQVAMVRVDLEGSWVGSVLRARKDLVRKTDLTEELVEASPFEGIPPEGALTQVPEGQRLMRPVAAGKIITRGDLEPIPLVQSGDKVKVVATFDYLSITMEATARSKGGLGERVRLEAPGSRRVVTVVVTGPGEARLLN